MKGIVYCLLSFSLALSGISYAETQYILSESGFTPNGATDLDEFVFETLWTTGQTRDGIYNQESRIYVFDVDESDPRLNASLILNTAYFGDTAGYNGNIPARIFLNDVFVGNMASLSGLGKTHLDFNWNVTGLVRGGRNQLIISPLSSRAGLYIKQISLNTYRASETNASRLPGNTTLSSQNRLPLSVCLSVDNLPVERINSYLLQPEEWSRFDDSSSDGCLNHQVAIGKTFDLAIGDFSAPSQGESLLTGLVTLDGTPLANKEVALLSPGKKRRKVITNDQGEFVFQLLRSPRSAPLQLHIRQLEPL